MESLSTNDVSKKKRMAPVSARMLENQIRSSGTILLYIPQNFQVS